MKKRFIIPGIIVLILLLPIIKNTFKKIVEPDKVLLVGHQISEYAFEFTKKIKDKDKIADFENLFDQIVFLSDEFKEETYADIILQINHKSGIFTHPIRIWINGDEGIALIPGLQEKNIGKLSKEQLELLGDIINEGSD